MDNGGESPFNALCSVFEGHVSMAASRPENLAPSTRADGREGIKVSRQWQWLKSIMLILTSRNDGAAVGESDAWRIINHPHDGETLQSLEKPKHALAQGIAQGCSVLGRALGGICGTSSAVSPFQSFLR
jgi:hypothetical protein